MISQPMRSEYCHH